MAGGAASRARRSREPESTQPLQRIVHRSPFKKAMPRTIKEYKTALLRLGIPLPAGQAKLAQYAKLYAETVAGEQEQCSTLSDATARFANPNVPLSLQQAASKLPGFASPQPRYSLGR